MLSSVAKRKYSVFEATRRRVSSIISVVSPSAMLNSINGGKAIDEDTETDSDSGSDSDSDTKGSSESSCIDANEDVTYSTTDTASACNDSDTLGASDEATNKKTLFNLLDDKGNTICTLTLLLRVSQQPLQNLQVKEKERSHKVEGCKAEATRQLLQESLTPESALTIDPLKLLHIYNKLKATYTEGSTEKLSTPVSPRSRGGKAGIGGFMSTETDTGAIQYAAVATSSCALVRIPASKLHAIINFYQLCESGPNSRLMGMPSGTKRRISVTAINSQGMVEEKFDGSASPGNIRATLKTRNSLTHAGSKRSSSTARSSLLKMSTVNGSIAVGAGASRGSILGSDLHASGTSTADSSEFGQSSADISAARMTLLHHSTVQGAANGLQPNRQNLSLSSGAREYLNKHAIHKELSMNLQQNGNAEHGLDSDADITSANKGADGSSHAENGTDNDKSTFFFRHWRCLKCSRERKPLSKPLNPFYQR